MNSSLTNRLSLGGAPYDPDKNDRNTLHLSYAVG